ncbi:MAG: DUF4080 domain-containing protein [Clostridia bacterium]|nr:DUF4080 domain-containing protein [Clostridia bacterium]
MCFHFELEGEIIDEETIEVLSGARAGAIQVEIGLQSFNEHTLDAINRRTNISLLCENIRKIVGLGNIHTHIDLIAGLPYEDIKSFESSFNRAVRLEPHMLQLGFLKLLHGSELRKNPVGVFEFDEKPPYEVRSTSYISRDELLLLHRIEDVFEKVYNSQRFPHTVKYLHGLYESPFDMYKRFALYLDTKKNSGTLDDFTLCMYEFFSKEKQVNKDYLRDCLAMDRLSTNRMGALPEFLKIHSRVIKKTLNQLEKNENTKRRDKIKRAATVLKSSKELIYVDYDTPDPVTGRFEIKRVKLESIF